VNRSLHLSGPRLQTHGVLLFALCVSLMGGIEWELAGFTITPERLLAPLLLCVAALVVAGRRGRVSATVPPIILVAWMVVALSSSLLSPVSHWALRMWVVQSLAIVFFMTTMVLKPDPIKLFASRWFLLVGFVLGPVASVVYGVVIALDGLPVLDGWIQYGGGTRLRALTPEANLLGAFLPLLIFGVWARPDRGRWGSMVVLIGLHVSLLLTFSRIPWFAYLCACLVYFLLTRRRRYTPAKAITILMPILATVIAACLAATVALLFFSDSQNLFRANSIDARFVMWQLALGDIKTNPILGNGVFSFSEMYPNAPQLVGSDTFRSAWISNLFLALIHDTGLLGAALLVAFLFIVLLRAGFASRRLALASGVDRKRLAVLAALTSAATALLISSQSIPSHGLAIFWLVFGLVATTTDGARQAVVGK
jgi:O-antigen ligase